MQGETADQISGAQRKVRENKKKMMAVQALGDSKIIDSNIRCKGEESGLCWEKTDTLSQL